MNGGPTAMVQKQRPSRPSGSRLVLHSQRRKVWQSYSKIKTMLTVVFFLIGRALSIMSMPLQAKLLIEYYLNVSRRLRDAIQQKWPQLWATRDWQLYHNNMSSRASRLVQSFLAKHQITQVIQPPYKTDLALCNFWLFPKLKSPLKGNRFQTFDEIQKNRAGQLMVSPTQDFAECFEQWKRRWENYVRSRGACFEGGWGIIVLCTMFLVSYIFFSKYLYFSYYMAR